MPFGNFLLCIATVLALVTWSAHSTAQEPQTSAEAFPTAQAQEMIASYCLDCHSGKQPTADLDLSSLLAYPLHEHAKVWEKVVRRLRARQMPPSDADRPPEPMFVDTLQTLEDSLDRLAAEQPLPGRTETFRRLTRFEYENSIRDLLALDIDASTFLPADEISHGFDNITVGELSPTLLNRYITAAQHISRLALGRSGSSPDGITVRVPPDVTQEEHVEGLPLGTRGGLIIPYTFPQDGEYEFRIRLSRDRNEHVEGLSEPHQIELLIDSAHAQSFTVRPPRGKADNNDEYSKPTHQNVDQHLVARIHVTAGQHEVGVTFLKNPSSLLETMRQPLNVHYNMYRHPRIGPAVYQVSVAGPFAASGVGDTPSRRRIFIAYPNTGRSDNRDPAIDRAEEEDCARQILTNLLRRACRKSITAQDLRQPMSLYRQAAEQGGFEAGIEMALGAVLINPQFLFRIEREPQGTAPHAPYQISDFELATRLSYFLWSSLPDNELLDLAEQGLLSQPQILTEQTRRMLADAKSHALVENFASQWLYLRNLDSTAPDLRLFPDFDDNLRQAFRQETELFVESIVREDRNVMDLLRSDYTYLNERLAKHYGIDHVYGSRFRRVTLDPSSQRGGLLRQGSILTVTSYATRTSPVIRGKWILENILGTPPPPPPPNVPTLTENSVSAKLPVRERLAQHRADAVCASCHDLIDPVGFSLENFDALGRWREMEEGQAVDASGGLPDGSRFDGADGLEAGLLSRPEIFVGTLTEKLLTYSLGRGIEHFDGPAIRKIVRDARDNDFRFSSLVLGIVHSTPFQMRMTQ
jgi:hypothetical protein